jgi:hypothetical protein
MEGTLPKGKGRVETGSGPSSEEEGAGVGWLDSPHKRQAAKGKTNIGIGVVPPWCPTLV